MEHSLLSTIRDLNVLQRLRCLIVFSCACFWQGLYAQNLYVDRISINDGLSQNSIIAITQDHKGYIWFGTQEGLNRYDGFTFKTYSNVPENPDSISNGNIRSLLVDHEGVLWVGTVFGLNRYDEETDKFQVYTHDTGDSNSISDNRVYSLFEDDKKHIWVSTWHGLNRFDKHTQIFTRFLHVENDESSLSNNNVNLVFQDSSSNLWVGTDRGVNIYDYATQSFMYTYDSKEILRTSIITAFGEDHLGRVWVGTAVNGIFIYDNNSSTFTQYGYDPLNNGSISSNKITEIFKDSKQQLWVGTEDAGLNRFDFIAKRFIRFRHNSNDAHSLSGDNVFTLFEDASDVIWIGSYTHGISKFNPYGFGSSLVSDKPSLLDQSPLTDVWAFLKDSENALWIGSSYDGIKVTLSNGRSYHYLHNPNNENSLSSNRVYSIFEDSGGTVWIGSVDGWLNRYKRSDHTFTRFNMQSEADDNKRHGKVRSILEDHKGLLWVALDGGGVHTFDRETNKVKHYHHDPDDPASISSDRVFQAHEDRNGDLWFNTYGKGLNKFDRATESFLAYKHDVGDENSLSNDYVLSIYEDNKKNILWLGSDNGIDRFNLTDKSFKNYNEKHGLANNIIYGILQDENDNLWVTHNRGLSKLNLSTLTFQNYNEKDGLQSNEFNAGAYYKSPDGKFYFGGIHGYNAFYPEDIIDNLHKPQVHINEIQLFNKPVIIGESYDDRILLTNTISNIDTLTLSYKDTVFSFEFVALDFANPSKNQYAYRMLGLEDNWNYVDSTRRYVTYTTLPPGDYTFQVKASNNHGVWNDNETNLGITITPPFWHAWWFRISIIIIFIFTLFTLYKLRVRAVHARNKILKEQVKARTQDLENTLYELSDTKDALIEAAHKAGMADTATGVLHNVGNLLNSVNTSAGVIREAVDNSVMNKIHKANELLIENQNDFDRFIKENPKVKTLLGYFVSLDEALVNEQHILRENILRLKDKITAINETISAQQRYAQGGGLFDMLLLETLVEDSILLQSASIDRHEIEIIRKYDLDVPQVRVQKAKLIQILINLYKNAKESMDACVSNKNKLTIEIRQDDEFVYVSYTDTGVGIDPDKLETIFAHGFTTKDEGHGFGLHSCANYMTEMGGDMWAESGGINQGAKFVLRFPLIEPQLKVAANDDENNLSLRNSI